MTFLKKIEDLIYSYRPDQCAVQDAAVLYGVYDDIPPLAKHIVYQAMPLDVMQHMIENYKLPFPERLLEIYSFMNGADLFWTSLLIEKIKLRIPINCLSIYGVPLTCDRKHLEPFNISLEDSSRPADTPDTWLKFGAFYKPENLHDKFDLFVDVKQGNVFAIKRKSDKCCIEETWGSIDDCLCQIFDLLSNQCRETD